MSTLEIAATAKCDGKGGGAAETAIAEAVATVNAAWRALLKIIQKPKVIKAVAEKNLATVCTASVKAARNMFDVQGRNGESRGESNGKSSSESRGERSSESSGESSSESSSESGDESSGESISSCCSRSRESGKSASESWKKGIKKF